MHGPHHTPLRCAGARLAYYVAYHGQHLPIGSGVVEAACKTLVTQRRKDSGMAWTMAGGQAILTLRSLLQSGRRGQAWPLLAADFYSPVVIPDNSTTGLAA
jgi:hypothetical protein